MTSLFLNSTVKNYFYVIKYNYRKLNFNPLKTAFFTTVAIPFSKIENFRSLDIAIVNKYYTLSNCAIT